MSAADFLPNSHSLKALTEAAQHCRGCDLYKHATQTVFGDGGRRAKVVFIGEQPGNEEDLAGRPFVGPSGRLLDEVLEEVGIGRDEVYVTNAVKHFKFTRQGKRRLHKKPDARELTACRPWLEAELAATQPHIVVCLGATAAQSLLGPKFRITKSRGQAIPSPWAEWTLATYHPSAVLRAPDKQMRDQMRAEFRHDLALVAEHIEQLREKPSKRHVASIH